MIVFNGKGQRIPGVEGQTYLERPGLRLARADYRPRGDHEVVRALMAHTSLGKMPQLAPGTGPRVARDERMIRMWRDDDRHAGAHLVIDFDGSTVCAADLLLDAAYHAGKANGWTIGLEIAQLRDGRIFEAQLRTFQAIAELVAELFELPHSYPGDARSSWRDRGWPRLEQLSQRGKESEWAPTKYGVIGHVHYGFRGPGDPGPWPFVALGAMGWCALP